MWISIVPLIGLIALGSCTTLNTPGSVAPVAPNNAVQITQLSPSLTAMVIHERNMDNYLKSVGSICGHSLRDVRVEKEAQLIEEVGKPVPLSTGTCVMILTIKSTGVIDAVHPGDCASDELSALMRKAVTLTSPLPPPPIGNGNMVNVMLKLSAPIATPGVYGN